MVYHAICSFTYTAAQVFGVPPPRTLYSRETTSSPSSPRSSSQPPSPAVLKNPNQSAYKGKTHRRILTSDSTTRLIPSPSSGSSGLASVYSHYQHSITTLNNIIERVRHLLPSFRCLLTFHRTIEHLWRNFISIYKGEKPWLLLMTLRYS